MQFLPALLTSFWEGSGTEGSRTEHEPLLLTIVGTLPKSFTSAERCKSSDSAKLTEVGG